MAEKEETVIIEESYTQQVQKSIKHFKITHYLSALLLVLAGIVLVARPGMALETVCVILGVMVIGAGLFYIVSYFVRGKLSAVLGMDLVLGIQMAGVGILLLTHPKAVVSIIPVIFGCVLFVSALVKLQTAIDMKRLGVTRWWITMVFALLTVMLAVVMVGKPFAAMQVLMVYVGISFIADGVLTLFSMIALGANLRRVKRLENGRAKETVDAEAEEKPLEW
ncbi:MAG: DUF308 domain-containing protein [Lachnospiraceae bacterium]|nr:DUF308 domain-containing protein [Lachnospiraceae bacterium]